MSESTPLTADELADLPDPALWVDEMDLPELALRLLATVDAERARADQAEADRMRWVAEVFPRVDAERARREQAEAERARREQAEAERDALVARLHQWASEWLCTLPATAPMRSEFRRALDASPTEGNPDAT